MSTRIIEGKIASHDRIPYRGQVTIDTKTGLITKVKSLASGGNGPADEVYDNDCIIFPGMGDVHIHAREDKTRKQTHKEEYQTAANAARNGGVVHVCAMPNTPIPVTSKKEYDWHSKRVAEVNHSVSILNYIGIDAKTKPLGKPGEHFYKLYFGKSVGDLTVTYGDELEKILANYKGHNISFHVEYEPIVQAHCDGETHSDRRPVACVNEGLRLLLPMIEKYRIKAKLCHWSTGGDSFELIKEYRKRGCDIVLEVSPLHLLFDTSMTQKDPSLWLKIQMNPAIQSPEHRKALIGGLKNNFIQYLATDHAPHTEEEKHGAFAKFKEHDEFTGMTNTEIADALRKTDKKQFLATCKENGASGAPWLDTYALVCIHLMKAHNFSAKDITRVAAYNPSNFVNPHLKRQFPKQNFGKGFGQIAKGYVGSLTVLNTKTKTKLTRDMLKTKANWSPLEGRSFAGGLEAVYIRGKKVI